MDVLLSLPEWTVDAINALPEYIPNLEDRMDAVIQFSRWNFERGTGGPFAAGVFERDTGKLITIGVNRVVPLGVSSAHAEVMALTIAQAKLKTFDLGAASMPAMQLVVNWRPCAMCFGATLWSGIVSLVIGGSGPELESITGFDEGPIHPEWKEELAKRGIAFQENVLHDKAVAVFKDFAASGALVYNGRSGS